MCMASPTGHAALWTCPLDVLAHRVKREMVFPMGPPLAVKGYGDRAFQNGSELRFRSIT